MTTQTAAQAERISQAVAELEALVRVHYPQATFSVAEGEDPVGTYLTVTVDLEDTEEVLDVVLDRLYELQVEEHLPVHVVVVRPPERVHLLPRQVPARADLALPRPPLTS